MSRVGQDLVEAFQELAAHHLGKAAAESYELPPDGLATSKAGFSRGAPVAARQTIDAK
jgi:hypothetical protein